MWPLSHLPGPFKELRFFLSGRALRWKQGLSAQQRRVRSIPAFGFARARCVSCKHSPGAPGDASFGAVTLLHRTGSFLNEHPHMHSAVTDGVFAAGDDGQVEFYPASELTPELVQNLQQTLRTRILRYLERHGRLDPGAVEDMLECPQDE